MLGLIESLVAISAIVITCRIAGRIPAMMVTAVAAASAAIIMPPFASWEVESTADVLTVVIQTIIGLAVVYKWPSKKGSRAASREARSLKSGAGQRIQFLDQHHPGKRCALAFPTLVRRGAFHQYMTLPVKSQSRFWRNSIKLSACRKMNSTRYCPM